MNIFCKTLLMVVSFTCLIFTMKNTNKSTSPSSSPVSSPAAAAAAAAATIDPWAEPRTTELLAQQAAVKRSSQEKEEVNADLFEFLKAADKGDTGSVTTMQKLLDKGVALNGQASLDKYGTDTYNALMIAIKSEKQPAFDFLLKQRGIDIEAKTKEAEDTALITASRYGNKYAVEELIKKIRANYQAQQKKDNEYVKNFINATNKAKETAMMVAAGSPRTNIRKILVEAQADSSLVDKSGLTALMRAAKNGDEDGVKQLLELKVAVNQKTADNLTALGYAIIKGHKKIVKQLLTAGADISIKFQVGSNELDAIGLADHYSKREIAELLREFKAKGEKRSSNAGKSPK